MQLMHEYTDETEALARAIVDYARGRIAEPQPLDMPVAAEELSRRAGATITPEGIGGEEALRIWSDVLAPAIISTDHPRFLAFVPGAPTKAAVLFDLVVGASSAIAANWLDGAGAIWAENEALRFLAGLAGLPEGAGGCFVSGGSAGNLSSLVTARDAAAAERGERPERWKVAASAGVHSSVVSAAGVMDVDVLMVSVDERGKLTDAALESAIDGDDGDGVFAVVASAGTTNAGVVDDLAGVARVCHDRGLWFHVDAAYGGGGLLARSTRDRYQGIESADSVVIDPHKWLYAPYDCCALLYRDPELARRAHTQEASYLDAVNVDEEWSPANYAYHLSRRARGLPFWFSLATYGTDAYRDAVEAVVALTQASADEIRRRPELELLMDPELSVVLFTRAGWGPEDYERWWRRLLAEQIAFVQPTSWEGEKVARLCFLNPRTTIEDVRAVLDTMA